MPSRRDFLTLAAAATAGLIMPPARAGVAAAPVRALAFYNIHTGERLTATYWADGGYVADELQAIDRLLRDFRTGDVDRIDPRLFDLLYLLQQQVRTDGPFHVISGYRSPATNALLREHTSGVARHSLHMVGKAIDIRLPGCGLATLHAAAVALRAGGVGYYPQSDFIHVDTGRVRVW